MSDQDAYRNVIIVLMVSEGVGIVADGWLFFLCRRGRPLLLKRQLCHQAAANLVFYSLTFSFKIWGLYDPPVDCLAEPQLARPRERELFVAKNFTTHGLVLVSCLMEVHIAASMFAISQRHARLLEFLTGFLPWVWMLALALDLLTFLLSPSWRRVENEFETYELDFVGVAVLTVTFVSILVFYIFAFVAVEGSRAPGVAITRSSHRAMVYPAIYALTAFPMIVRNLGRVEVCSVNWVWTFVFEDLFGPLTALAYMTLNGGCRYREICTPRSISLPTMPSYSVGFASVAEEFGGSFSTSRAMSTFGSSISSMNSFVPAEASSSSSFEQEEYKPYCPREESPARRGPAPDVNPEPP